MRCSCCAPRYGTLIRRGLHRWDRLNSCGSGARAPKILPLQDDVREKKRKGDAHPDHSLGDRITQFFQSSDAKDYANFKKHDGHGEAAGHPLAMQLNLAFQDEIDGDGGGQHPDRGIGERGETKGTRAPHALFVILDVETEWGTDENTRNVEAPDNAMKFCETLAEAIGELHWPEQESACSHDAVRQKIPFERADVSPFWVLGIDEEAFIMDKNVGIIKPINPNKKYLGRSQEADCNGMELVAIFVFPAC